MPDNNGRPNTLEDYLTSVKRDNGKHMKFGFNPIVTENDKIYANLVIQDGGSKPTEQACTNGLAALQATWDAEFAGYRKARRDAHINVKDQLDQLYHDINDGKLGNDAKTGSWYLAVKTIKDNNPKG